MRILPCLIFVLSLTVAPVAAFVAASPPGGAGPVLVLMPPWADADRLVGRAGGWVVGPLRAPFAVLATTQRPGTAKDDAFSARLMRNGAWAVRAPGLLASICGMEKETRT